MELTYTRTINTDKLHKEVLAVQPLLDCITTHGSSITIKFTDTLDQTAIDVIDALISAHDVTEKEYKIYDYTYPKYIKTATPYAINFKTELSKGLYDVSNMTDGVCTSKTFYGTSDGTTNSDPVVKESYVYVRDAANLATSVTVTTSWYYTDGTEDTENTKIRTHYLPAPESIKEGKQRRNNILDELQLIVVGLIMQTELVNQTTAIVYGSTFMEDYAQDINSWINTPAKYAFQNRINAEVTGTTDYQWLFNDIGGGLTVRDYILSKINY
jgi:hypothetical protein